MVSVVIVPHSGQVSVDRRTGAALNIDVSGPKKAGADHKANECEDAHGQPLRRPRLGFGVRHDKAPPGDGMSVMSVATTDASGIFGRQAVVELASGGRASCADARELAAGHLQAVKARIADLRRMERVLAGAVKACDAGDDPGCPLIDTLGGRGEAAPIGFARSRRGAMGQAADDRQQGQNERQDDEGAGGEALAAPGHVTRPPARLKATAPPTIAPA